MKIKTALCHNYIHKTYTCRVQIVVTKLRISQKYLTEPMQKSILFRQISEHGKHHEMVPLSYLLENKLSFSKSSTEMLESKYSASSG